MTPDKKGSYESWCRCLTCRKVFAYRDRYIPERKAFYEGKCPYCHHTFTFISLYNRSDLAYINRLSETSQPMKKYYKE